MKTINNLEFNYKYHHVNGLTLHVGQMGPVGGEKILLLHGFPEFSQGWTKLATFFANQGYCVIAPDQRGYNLSEKPASIKVYALTHLVDDMAALIISLTKTPIAIVGHDWGGGVAWGLAQRHPEMIKKLIVLAMPHPQVMKKNLRNNLAQMLKSWYAAFFQLPFIPEKIYSIFNYKLLEKSMVGSAPKGTFSKDYISACKKAWKQPGALSAMMNWYRAFLRVPEQTNADISIPVLLLWGKQDAFLTSVMAAQSIRYCSDGHLIMFKNASHWLHHEEPALVANNIQAFLKKVG